MKLIVQCPRCKGKGYIWDKVGLAMLTVAAPLVWLIESGEPPSKDGRGFKQECGRCDGHGYIKAKAVK